MAPKIRIDFRKGSCTNPKFCSVLCASKRTRGAVGKECSGIDIIFRRAKKKAGGRRCRPFPFTSQREEVLAGHPGEQREEVPPAGYSLDHYIAHNPVRRNATFCCIFEICANIRRP
jgi:hypothetical protein